MTPGNLKRKAEDEDDMLNLRGGDNDMDVLEQFKNIKPVAWMMSGCTPGNADIQHPRSSGILILLRIVKWL